MLSFSRITRLFKPATDLPRRRSTDPSAKATLPPDPADLAHDLEALRGARERLDRVLVAQQQPPVRAGAVEAARTRLDAAQAAVDERVALLSAALDQATRAQLLGAAMWNPEIAQPLLTANNEHVLAQRAVQHVERKLVSSGHVAALVAQRDALVANREALEADAVAAANVLRERLRSADHVSLGRVEQALNAEFSREQPLGKLVAQRDWHRSALDAAQLELDRENAFRAEEVAAARASIERLERRVAAVQPA